MRPDHATIRHCEIRTGGAWHDSIHPTPFLDRDHGGHRCWRHPATREARARAGRSAQVRAREGRDVARAALEALRAGRRRSVHGQHAALHSAHRRRGAGRQRELRGSATQGGGRGQRRRRTRHHHQHRRATAAVPGQAAGRERAGRVPGTEVRRLVRDRSGILHARGQMDRDPHRCRRRRDGLPQEHAARRRLRGISQGPERLPQAVPGAEGEGHTAGLRTRPCHR